MSDDLANIPKMVEKIPVMDEISQGMLEKRLTVVRTYMTRGYSTNTICTDLAKRWSINKRDIRNYMLMVMQDISEGASFCTTETRRSQRRAQLEYLYERSVMCKDYKTASVVMEKLCRVDGIYAPEQHSHNVNHSVAAMTEAQRDDRLKFLLEERAKFLNAASEQNYNSPETEEEIDKHIDSLLDGATDAEFEEDE